MFLQKVIFVSVLVLHYQSSEAAAPSTGIPTREEQANLLDKVQAVFEAVKTLVSEEGKSTDKSIVAEVQRMNSRAGNHLDTLQQLASLKLTCNTNNVCALDTMPLIERLVQDAREVLTECATKAGQQATVISETLQANTSAAMEKGQSFVDGMRGCSNRKGATLGVVQCYRGIINNEVEAVKSVILGALRAHQDAHEAMIVVRLDADECVDSALKVYMERIEQALQDAAQCQ